MTTITAHNIGIPCLALLESGKKKYPKSLVPVKYGSLLGRISGFGPWLFGSSCLFLVVE